MPQSNSLSQSRNDRWPELPLDAWADTYATLHLWLQMVGKVRVALSPPLNHFWQSALYLSARGLTTSTLFVDDRSLEIEFDFIDHVLHFRTSTGEHRALSLSPRAAADFFAEFKWILSSLEVQVPIWPMPQEIPSPIRFDQDRIHSSYDPEYAQRFWRILLQTDRVLKIFRGRFLGKCSPVHFFWGSMDLAVTRFSGRHAPERPGADRITREAYSHEVSSVGFWPGSGNIRGPAFYSYAAPEPAGFSEAQVRPASAFYNPPTKGFILMYDEVRTSSNPEQMILDFAQSTYEAAANLGSWDRVGLERQEPLSLGARSFDPAA